MLVIKKHPLVSVIITSYNREDLISKTIESVLSQNYENLEIIIIDNCSTDKSEEIIQSYAINNSQILYIKNEKNLGFVGSLFKAINISKGDFFTHVSSDDYLLHNNFITEAIERSLNVVDPVIICSNVSYLLDSTGQLSPCTARETYAESFYKQPFVDGKLVFLEYTKYFPITMGACIINRQAFSELNIDKVAPIHSDIEMILQLLLLGNVIFLDYEAYVVRLHGANISHSFIPVSENITNFSFIETPYKLAKSLNSFSNDELLNRWKAEMLYNYAFLNMSKYYRLKRTEYQIFKEHIKEVYPATYNRIKYNLKWIAILILFKNVIVGNLAVKFRHLFIIK